jgi:uncharacterized protein
MRALLDVNVLIALLDAAHVHHPLATAWLRREQKHGWASCPITQIGCVRIMSQPAYPGTLRAADVAERLGEACAHAVHVFWPDSVDLLGSPTVSGPHVLGHRQVTHAYLLTLAVKNRGRLVSFDRRIAPGVVVGAKDGHLVVIAQA